MNSSTQKALSNGWVVTLQNTMRQKLRRDVFYERLVARAQGLGSIEADYRNLFCWCAGHTTLVEYGMWQSPAESASESDLVEAFNAWVDAVGDETIAAEWYEAIIKLTLPLAPLEQQPLKNVPEETKDDPNFQKGGKDSSKKSRKISAGSPAAS